MLKQIVNVAILAFACCLSVPLHAEFTRLTPKVSALSEHNPLTESDPSSTIKSESVSKTAYGSRRHRVNGTAPIPLPIEVMGRDGTTVSISVPTPPERIAVTKLWMQVNNLSYDNKASLRIDNGPWIALNNAAVAVDEPGKSYGGIGGAFSSISFSVPLPEKLSSAHTHEFSFRFNHSDGVSSGFRILNLQLLTAQNEMVLPHTTFIMDNPDTWQPPFKDASDISTGASLWHSARLLDSDLPDAPRIKAACSDCHADDGRDLKFFNFSNYSIVARSRFHGLTEHQGEQIASYIRTLKNADGSIVPNPGRPWNPPYQPGPGLDSQPIQNWSAGAGLSAVLSKDSEMLPYLFPHGISKNAVATSNTLNLRELPIALQLIDWNHWLPRIHPKDAWGNDFVNDNLNKIYRGEGTGASPWNLGTLLSGSKAAVMNPHLVQALDAWEGGKRQFLRSRIEDKRIAWSHTYATKVYSTAQWRMVKLWELMQEFQLEDRGKTFFGAQGEERTWPADGVFFASPALLKIPNDPKIFESKLTFEYLNNSWYYLQAILNAGNRQRAGTDPVDWGYVGGRVNDLATASHVPEAMRLTALIVKGMQQGDNGKGVSDNFGWAPENVGDVSLLVQRQMEATTSGFDTLPNNEKTRLLEAVFGAWIDTARKFTPQQYYKADLASPTTDPSRFVTGMHGLGFNTYTYMLPGLYAAGVSSSVTDEISDWGRKVWPAGNWNALKAR